MRAALRGPKATFEGRVGQSRLMQRILAQNHKKNLRVAKYSLAQGPCLVARCYLQFPNRTPEIGPRKFKKSWGLLGCALRFEGRRPFFFLKRERERERERERRPKASGAGRAMGFCLQKGLKRRCFLFPEGAIFDQIAKIDQIKILFLLLFQYIFPKFARPFGSPAVPTSDTRNQTP